MAATVGSLSCCHKRKGFASETIGALPSPDAPFKRLRLEEPASPPARPIAAAPRVLGAPAATLQPTSPAAATSARQYSVKGQPALWHQQRLPTIPEIHQAGQPGWEERHAAEKQQWCNPAASPLQQTPPLRQLPAARQYWAPVGGAQPLAPWAPHTPPSPRKQQWAGFQAPLVAQQPPAPPPQQQHATADIDIDDDGLEACDNSAGLARPMSGAGAAAARPTASSNLARWQACWQGAHHLVVPQNLTKLSLAALDPGCGALHDLPTGDYLAVVPYTPPEEVCRRVLHSRRLPPPPPMEPRSSQRGFHLNGSSTDGCSELAGGELRSNQDAASLDSDAPVAMEE